MIRITLLLLVCQAAVLPGSVFPQDATRRDNPRNVVLFVVDDHGFQAGCYGDTVARTPNIDRLAAAGTRFTRAHCTTASCSASRSVLLTGLQNHAIGHYGHAHGDNHFSTYESVPTLPVLLAEAGYRTCSIGKYHVAPEYVYHFESYANEGIQGARNAVRMAENAKEWIARDGERPFFLYFCTSDPHRGGGPGGFANRNDNPDFYPGVTPVRYHPDKMVVPAWLPDIPEVRRELAEYYQAVSRLDQGLGVLLDALEETGHDDDTLVIFLSDNGPPFPGAKTNLYQPGMNLPLIVRLPGHQRRGIANDALVSWADITPTILDFCGVTPPPAPAIRTAENVGERTTRGPKRPVEFHGRSFLSIIEDEHPDGWDESYASHTFHEITMYYPMRCITSGNYKYIFNIAHPLPYPFASDLYASPTWQAVLRQKLDVYGRRAVYAYLQRERHELYDLAADPDELHNLASDPRHREKLAELQEKLKSWQQRTRDPWVSKWEYE
jgi:N-sulfoglucosamine sulfohydrolase